ncbi:MAG: L,D-transpeptidase [Cyanobacteria bacterium P01_A01_bin.84]
MAILRNDSFVRIIMLSCFGTAILLLFISWRTTSASKSETIQPNKTNPTQDLVSENGKNIENPKSSNPLNLISNRILNQKKTITNPVANNIKVVVDLSDRRVYVYNADRAIASYPTGIGKQGWETPVGSFNVIQKIPNPSWRHPITGKVFPAGVDSPLGKRWVGFWSDGRNYIGFHGTPDYDKVGSAVSHGCLRMRNDDVMMLYQQVSMGTPVEVRQ